MEFTVEIYPETPETAPGGKAGSVCVGRGRDATQVGPYFP